jgi:hypothetical protein
LLVVLEEERKHFEFSAFVRVWHRIAGCEFCDSGKDVVVVRS